MVENEKFGALNREIGEPSDCFAVGNDEGVSLRIYLRFAIFQGLRDIAIKDTSKVQTMLLLGRHDPQGKFVEVRSAVRVKSHEGQLDESVWRAARRLASEREPQLEVVGWYCSHPNAGLNMNAQERELHRRFFPEKWQVFYVSDPLLNERCFYNWQAGQLVAAGGFRIFGKEEVVKKMNDREPIRQDEHLRERYLERSVDKLQKLVQNPSVRKIDYVIIGMLVLVLGIVLMRPQPVAKTDPELLQRVEQMSSDITDLTQKVNKLEGHLGAVGAIDTSLKLVGEVSPDVVGSKTATAKADGTVEVVDTTTGATATLNTATSNTSTDKKTSKSSTLGRKVDGVAVGSKVEMHTIADGDTLYSICEQYYGTASTDMAEALGKFNKLTPPNYDIFPGEQLMIPAKEALGQ